MNFTAGCSQEKLVIVDAGIIKLNAEPEQGYWDNDLVRLSSTGRNSKGPTDHSALLLGGRGVPKGLEHTAFDLTSLGKDWKDWTRDANREGTGQSDVISPAYHVLVWLLACTSPYSSLVLSFSFDHFPSFNC